jgi:hypothetical protein
MITNLTPQQLRQAADLQEKILALQHQLAQLVGASTETSTPATGKRRLSAQGLANIRAGARKRWGKTAANGTSTATAKPKRKISAAGRARISAMLKARWAAAKKSGRNAL